MLRLRLCGPMTAELAGEPLGLPTSERARALVAWLALYPGSHPRAVIAAQLWPDAGTESARANLRTALWAVRTAWGDAGSPLVATRTTLALDDVSVDVDDEPTLDEPVIELLPGMEDEWVLRARAQLDDRRAAKLAEAADRAEADADVATAVRWTRRLTELRPFDESAHRALVERLLRSGERGAAMIEAKAFAAHLLEEIGVRPSPATRAVHARAQAGGGAQQVAPVFGRAEEVGRLMDAWREAADGRGQVVVLTGEAGIGKTTLVGELIRRVSTLGGHVATASGVDTAGETPFAAWLELARSLAGAVRQAPPAATWPAELNRLSPGLGARLGHPQQPPAAGAPELERLRVFEALLRLVEWSCAERPVLLAMDDAHRADRASLRLAAYVGLRLARLPALLVLTRRAGVRRPELDALMADLAGHGVRVTEVDVPPISDRDIGALARSLHSLDGTTVDKVVAAAEGNPLLAVEAARALVAGSDGPPPNLRAAVAATLSRVPDTTVSLAELLAAAGRPLWPEELRRLEAPSGFDAVTASEGLLVRREGRLGFRHELLRAAVYAGLADPAGVHDRLADGIDPTEHVERAHHLAEAGRSREAAAELARAAVQARTVGALDESAELLERAVSLDPDDGHLWLELEETCAYAHRHQEMETAWAQALARLPEDALPEAWCRRGRQFRTVDCHPEESLRAYRTAQRLATPDTPPIVLADALIGMAWGDAVAGPGDDFERLLTEAFRLTDVGPQLEADALEIRMQGLIRQARFEEAAALVAEPDDPMARLVDRFPDRRYSVLVNAASALVCAGDDEAALAMVERALSTGSAASAVTGLELKTVGARAQILARVGRHEEAAATAEQVQQWADRLDDPTIAATVTYDRGLLAMQAGRYAEAAEHVRRALAGNASISRVAAGLTRAEALARIGDTASALAQLRTALLEPVGRSDQPWALVPRIAWVQALVAYAEGDVATTRRRLDESAAAWRRVAAGAREQAGEDYVASLVDLGRPPVVGLVEPGRELDRIAELVAVLDTDSEPVR